MAEYQKQEINDTTATENITLEQEAAAIDAKAEEASQTEEVTNEVSAERPEWLPEKFQSVEDMAKAYNELEQKQSSGEEAGGEEEVAESEQVSDDPQLNTVEIASQEFADKGELSEATYEKLAEVGLGKEMVDQYIAGQQAILEQQSQAIYSEIGGKEEYEQMSEWASESLSDADLEAYNETVESGTVDQAKFAVKALYAQYKGTSAPTPMQGSTNGSAVAPYTSRAQVTEAMRSKQYQTDPAFRNQVQQRLSISNLD